MNTISQKDKAILKELAKIQIEYAKTPKNEERKHQWFLHNDLKDSRPLVTIEEGTFEHELARSLACETEKGREFELQLMRNIVAFEDIDDDRAMPDFFSIRRPAWFLPFGVKSEKKHVKNSIAFEYDLIIHDLAEDRSLLGASEWGYSKDTSDLELAQEIFSGIIPVREISHNPNVELTQILLRYMSMETMMFSLYDEPELFHEVLNQLSEDMMKWFREMENGGYFITNNQIQHVGQGTCSANTKFAHKDGAALSEMWGYFDSQETSPISPDMYKEFIFPYYKRIMDACGLVNYGCCEAVHPIWDSCLSTCANLRKVSISPWCDEEFMGERLHGSNVIFHRKPSPNLVGAAGDFNEASYSDHIIKTLKAAKGCKLEFSLRDIYSLGGEKNRAKRVVQLIRNLIELHWEGL